MLRAGGKQLMVLGFGRHVTAFPSGEACGFHERVMDHYNNTRNVGSFDKNDPTVGTGLVGSLACGDVLKFQIKVDENTNKIVDTCFKAFGCGEAFIGLYTYKWIMGKQMEELLDIKNTEIPKHLSLPPVKLHLNMHLSLPPVKLHLNMLAEDAIKAAVKDYKAKRGKLGSKNGVSTTENTEKDAGDA